jgi:uncharacterized protein (TIGR00251 family)
MREVKAAAPTASTVIAVKVVPRASQSRVEGWQGGVLKVRLTAPPVEGKANAALVALLAKALGIRSANVDIVGGETARTKRVRINGLSAADINARLGTG